MHGLGKLLGDRRIAALVVALVLILSAVAASLASGVRHEDDLLAFLPADNEDIAQFRAINQRFGGLEVAIVGLEVGDAFDGPTLGQLDQLTDSLMAMPALDHVLTLTNVDDFAPDPMGGIRTSTLIEEIPDSPEASAALRRKVMSREHVAGTLVSRDGTALVVYAFPAFGADTRQIANDIAAAARTSFPDQTLHLGGAPFVSSYIYDTTQADMRRLTPWAVLAIVAILLLAFRDLRSVALGMFSTGAGICVVYATMSVLDMPVNVVLGAMPVILFAIGSAYGIHMLARYSVHAVALPLEEAVAKTVGHTGPVVLTAGLTTAAGLASFVVMDIEPLQQFGLLSALGVAVTLLLSVTFVPAVVVLLRLKPRAVGSGLVGRGLAAEVAAIGRNRFLAGFALALVLGVAGIFAVRVDTRLDQAAFYDAGSPPDRADRFLRERFGGANFVQIEATGDLADPVALRSLRQLADQLSLVDGVHRVQHVGDVIASLNDAMEGQPRIPDATAKVGLLYGFLTGNPAVRQLVDQDHTHTLMHVRLSTADVDATERALNEIEQVVADQLLTQWREAGGLSEAGTQRRRDLVADRILAITRPFGRAKRIDILRAVDLPPPPTDPAAVTATLALWLQSGESMVLLPKDAANTVAAAVVSLPQDVGDDVLEVTLGEALEREPGDPEIADLVWSIRTPLAEARRDHAASAHASALITSLALTTPPESGGIEDAHLSRGVAAALLDLQLERVGVPDPAGEGRLDVVVSGTPVLHRGLSESTRTNQRSSLLFALGTVAVLLAFRFRSLSGGLLAVAPTGAALLVIYGGMGALGIRLDIGTSMLASIVVGAGVDYGVHLLSAWYANPDETGVAGAVRAAARTGGAIWTNALAVSAGFFVLTLGDARPLKNVGGLTAAAMIVAAGCTFIVIPLLGRRRRYDRSADPHDPADPAVSPSLRNTP
jgi:uncharacterized protein